jgi:hypothetical protein
MDITFNPDTQLLQLKQVYIDRGDIITVLKNGNIIWSIDPNVLTQEQMIELWYQGLRHIWDVIDK